MQSPQTQAFSGCKLAASGNAVGTGLKLNFSDTNNWEQLKADMEDKTALKRILLLMLRLVRQVSSTMVYKIVDVIYYPLGEYTDEKPARVAANKAAEPAE